MDCSGRNSKSYYVFLTHVNLSSIDKLPISVTIVTKSQFFITSMVFCFSSDSKPSTHTQSLLWHSLHSTEPTLSLLSGFNLFCLRTTLFPRFVFCYVLFDFRSLASACLFFMWVQRAAYEPQALPQPSSVHQNSFWIYSFFLRWILLSDFDYFFYVLITTFGT